MARKVKATPNADALAVTPQAAPVVLLAADIAKLDESRKGLERYAAEVTSRTEEITRELPIYKSITVASEAELVAADTMLTELVRWKDASIEMRGNATAPLYKIVKTVEAWFRPLVKACEEAEAHLKKQIGGFRVKLLEAKQVAERAAVSAAQSGNSAGLLEALNASTELATAESSGNSTTRYRWNVERVNPDLLPDEYWCPDMAKILAVLDAAPADTDETKPVIPGVIITRAAMVGAKR